MTPPVEPAAQRPADDVADDLLDLLDRRPPTLGEGRLLCLDGPAGSGKTTLAAAVAQRVDGAVVVHTDDLLEGWTGLPGLPALWPGLLTPLASGQPGRYRRWDWHADAFAEWVEVPVSPLLVLEGVGSGARTTDPWRTALAWVEVDPDLRLSRGLARDGEAARPHWERWTVDEQHHFAEDGTRGRADLHA